MAVQPSDESRPPRSLVGRIFGAALLGIPAIFALSQIFIWNFWEPPWGDSPKYLITYAQILLGTICLIGWWFLFAPVSRRVRLGCGIPLLLLIAGWVAVQRMPELSGDMVVRFHYRWEPPIGKFDPGKSPQTADAQSTRQIESVPIVQPEDMPAYRGIHRNGHVIGPPLKQAWSPEAVPELWRHPVGGGYSSMVIAGDYLFTLEQRGEDEAIVCYDARNGSEIWQYRYPADFFEAMGGRGPRATPTIDGDGLYSLGAFGDLVCLDLQTGKLRWHVNSLQQFHVANTSWGMSSSPLIHEDHVIINIGGQSGNGLIAYAARTGDIVWKTAGLNEPELQLTSFETGAAAVPKDLEKNSLPGYSSPELATIAGKLQILNLDGVALSGHDPMTGEKLWSVPFKNGAGVNVAQPVVFDDGRVFISASYDVGCKMLRVQLNGDAWSVEEVWANRNMRCKFTSPVLIDNLLFGLDEGILVCLDPDTGERLWKGGKAGLRGRYNHGQILTTNGQILALTEQGMAVLVQPDRKQLKEVTSMRVLPEGKNWNPLVLCRGRLYVRNDKEMACFDLEDHMRSSDKPDQSQQGLPATD